MKSIRRFAVVSVVLIALMALLAACGDDKKDDNASKSNDTTTTAAPATAESTTTTTAASKEPTITVEPSTGLTDGQKVHIKATGFPATTSVAFNQCADKGNETGAGDCNLGAMVAQAPDGTPLKTDASGNVEGDYTVHKGPFGANQIVCGAAQACVVSVSNLPNADVSAATDVTFAG